MKYNFFEKILHNISLGSNLIKKSLFEIESILFLNKKDISQNKHVFISGLPRAGTTIILEYIFGSNQFASLKYQDMPLVMAPNFYSKFSKKKNFNKIERMHKDNLFYNLESPEAFEEVFFSTFQKDNEWEKKIINYLNLIVTKYNKYRYLSKNNYNFRRFEKLSAIFPNSAIVIPFRQPLFQSYSMYRQHLNFSSNQEKDKFILKYTNYLGHYEFGKNHKPWFKPNLYNDKETLNYWLEQWSLYYQFILDIKDKINNPILLCYESFCLSSEYRKIFNTKINIKSSEFNFNESNKNFKKEYDQDLYQKCEKIYNILKDQS